jgi:hypothetical protein
MGKPEGTRPLGRPRHRWVDSIKIDLREVGWAGIDWIDLAQDRPVEGCCEHGNEQLCGEEVSFCPSRKSPPN